MAAQTIVRRPGFARRSMSPVSALQSEMDRFMNQALWSAPFRTLWTSNVHGDNERQTATWPLPLDAYATADEVVIIAAAPGLGSEDIEITYDQGAVTFAGRLPNVAASEEGKDATWYLHELPYGDFRRSVTLPFEIDADAIEATFANGVLRLRLPKAEQARPKQIQVRVVENGAGHVDQPAEAITAQSEQQQ